MQMMNRDAVDVLIIGAGISGLLCATELQAQGARVLVVDKGRGVGGRLSTRLMSGARIDHGAQFFTVRDPRLQPYVERWLAAGVIREWFRQAPWDNNPAGYPRYCGVSGMNALPKYLAATLDVRSGEKIDSLVRTNDRWIARSQQDRSFTAEQLILTTPLPQALLLMATTGLNWAGQQLPHLQHCRYAKGLATLAILDAPSRIPDPGAIKPSTGPLAWIADNQMKGISPEVTALTLHATPEFAAAHWHSSDAVRGQLMLAAAQEFIPGAVVDFCCHRWGFTLPLNPWPQPYFAVEALNVVLAGDAFGGPRVEGAALSGLAAATALLERV
jgi:predicted NAD/FAD-dependent oxidoreductase